MKNVWIEKNVTKRWSQIEAMSSSTDHWSFDTALGDIIKEKYENDYVKIIEISNVINRKTLDSNCCWIVTSPEVTSVFETATAGSFPSVVNWVYSGF